MSKDTNDTALSALISVKSAHFGSRRTAESTLLLKVTDNPLQLRREASRHRKQHVVVAWQLSLDRDALEYTQHGCWSLQRPTGMEISPHL